MIKIRNYTIEDYSEVKAILQEVNMFDKSWDSEENFASMINKDLQKFYAKKGSVTSQKSYICMWKSLKKITPNFSPVSTKYIRSV